MPGTTATQGLVYPVGTDRACDGALQIQVLAQGMAARYVVLDSLLDLAERPPAVLVEWWDNNADSADPMTNNGVIWNTVSIDDANAYDAGISPTSITLPYVAPGQLWEIGMFARGSWESLPDVEVEYMPNLRVTSQTGTVMYDFDPAGLPARASWSNEGGNSLTVLHETTGNDVVVADWDTFNNGGKLEFAQLWAFRIGEA